MLGKLKHGRILFFECIKFIIIFQNQTQVIIKHMKSNLPYTKWKNSFKRLEVTQLDKEESDKFFEQGRKYMEENKKEQALKSYERALLRNPLNFKAHCNRGTIYKSLNQYQKARNSYNECLKINPNDILTLYNLGNLEKYVGNYDEAISKYKSSIKKIQVEKTSNKNNEMINRIYLNCLVNIGVSFKITNRLNEALEWNQRLIKQFPLIQQGYFNKGMCLMKELTNKQYIQHKILQNQICNQAQLNFRKCLQINNQNAKAQASIIECQYLINKTQENLNNCKAQLQALKGKYKTEEDLRIIQNKIKLLENIRLQMTKPKSKQNIRIKKVSNNSSPSHSNQNNYNSALNSSRKLMTQLPSKTATGSLLFYTEGCSQQQFQLLINQNKYDQALDIANKMIESLQKYEKIIIANFIKAWESGNQQLHEDVMEIFQKKIFDEDFASIKNRISVIGHEVFAFILKTQQFYLKAVQHYQYLIEGSYSYELEDQNDSKMNYFLDQIKNCFIEGRLIQQGIKFYKNMLSKFPSSTNFRFNACLLMMHKDQQFYNQVHQIIQKFTTTQVAKLSKQNKLKLNFMHALSNKSTLQQISRLKNLIEMIQEDTELTKNQIQQQWIMKLFVRVADLLFLSCNKNSLYFQNHNNLFRLAISCKNTPLCNKFCLQILYLAIGQSQLFRQNYYKALKYFKKVNVCRDQITVKMALCFAKVNKKQDAMTCINYELQAKGPHDYTVLQHAIYSWSFDYTKQVQQLKNELNCPCLNELENKQIYGMFLIQKLIKFQYQSKVEQLQKQKIIQYLRQQIRKFNCCDTIKKIIQRKNTFTIKMLSLNYSGVLTSPYQFFQEKDQKLVQISKLFSEMAKKYIPNFDNQKFSWQMGTLDTKWKQRYTPFNILTAGVKSNNKMMNQQQFKDIWEKVHQQTLQSLKQKYYKIKYKDLSQQKLQIVKNREIQSCRLFDLICYRTFMKLIYNVQDIKQINLDSKAYIQQRQNDFKKSFLNEKKKQQLTVKNFQKIEHSVIFLQQTNDKLINQFRETKKYYIRHRQGIDSIILFNLSQQLFANNGESYNFQEQNEIFLNKFKKLKDITKQDAMNLLNINNDSIFQAYDRFLFWNVHPTSNKEKNAVQIQQMKTTFIEITQLLPEYKIILGGDFNSAFSPTIKTDDGQEDMKISYFPRDPSIPTCKKMRTMMQPQKNKANKLDQSPKDYFVSQLPIVQQKCSLISGQELDLKNLPLLPNKEHPYDHYLVCTNLQFKQKIKDKNRQNQLLVMSLNYSGVLTSPYQYYEYHNQKQIQISNLFAQEATKIFPNFNQQGKFTWEMGTLDTKWKQRYSPFNIITAGVKQNNKMMNQQQFKDTWQKVHQQTFETIKKIYFKIKYKQLEPDKFQQKIKTQIEKCRSFDFVCYKTFMRLIYKVQDIKQINLDSYQYVRQRTQHFNKPFLNDKLKLKQTLDSLQCNQHDVVFLQQANVSLMNSFTRKYFVKKQYGIDSIILFNLQQQFFANCPYDHDFQEQNFVFLNKYSKLKKITVQQIKKILNINNDSVFQVYDKFLFWNVHPTSNKEKNAVQIQQMKNTFIEINQLLPEYKIILGGDFNSVFSPTIKTDNGEEKMKVSYFPRDPNIPTCKKMRTMMQPQKNKANKLDQSPKDYFVSKLPIVEQKCSLISGQQLDLKNLPLLPNKEHPYDHYLIYLKLKIN